MEPKLDHRSLIRDLPINVNAELTQRSDVKGLSHLGGYFASLLMCSTRLCCNRRSGPFYYFLRGCCWFFFSRCRMSAPIKHPAPLAG